jgi:hypothetical protein
LDDYYRVTGTQPPTPTPTVSTPTAPTSVTPTTPILTDTSGQTLTAGDLGVAPTPAPAAPTTGSPEWFKQYIYQGGADDTEATRRGIEWVTQQGMRPQDAVNLWNQSLGTNFNVTDFFGQTGSGPELTNFGDKDSWDFGEGAKYLDSTGMIHSSGTYFQRGNDAIVSDELFWNPNSPTGAALKKKIDDARAQGQRPGVVVTPYAVFQGKATDNQLLAEIQNSGVDFVALDPYVGWGVPSDQLVDWTKNFIAKANALGKEVKLVTQGFSRTGQETETTAHNQKLFSLPGVSEFINFGLEDAKDLQGSSEWVSLNNDYKQPEKRTISGTGTTAGDLGVAPTPTPTPTPTVGTDNVVLTGADGQTLTATDLGVAPKSTPTPTPAPTAASAKTIDTSNPANLITNILAADPNAAGRLVSSRTQAFDLGEGSTFNDFGEQFGGFTVKAMPNTYDFSGNATGTGFTASKSATGPNGQPIETTFNYDASGNLQGSVARVFTGSDSGFVIDYDPSGKIIGQSQFDYSEGWKKPVSMMASWILPALGPYGMLANAAIQASQGNYLGAIAAGAGAGAEFAGPTGTFLGVAQPTFQMVSSGANIANALKSGNWAAALSAIASSPFGADFMGTQIGDTGFTLADATKGASALKAIKDGQYGQAITSLGQLANSQDTVIAGRAASLLQAFQSKNPQAILNASQQFSAAMSDPGRLNRLSGTGTTSQVTGGDLGGVGDLSQLNIDDIINVIRGTELPSVSTGVGTAATSGAPQFTVGSQLPGGTSIETDNQSIAANLIKDLVPPGQMSPSLLNWAASYVYAGNQDKLRDAVNNWLQGNGMVAAPNLGSARVTSGVVTGEGFRVDETGKSSDIGYDTSGRPASLTQVVGVTGKLTDFDRYMQYMNKYPNAAVSFEEWQAMGGRTKPAEVAQIAGDVAKNVAIGTAALAQSPFVLADLIAEKNSLLT